MINDTDRALLKPIRDSITILGDGYEIVQTSEGDLSEIYKIQSTIKLVRARGVSPVVFNAFKHYVEENIKQVFTSPEINTLSGRSDEYTNKGLPKDVVIDAGDVQVQEIPIGQVENSTLNDNENLFVVIDNASERSFVMDSYNKRLGTFFISNGWGNMITQHNGEHVFNSIPGGIRNDPAHEFAHILGLADRYTIIAQRDGDKLVTDARNTSHANNLMGEQTHLGNFGSLSRWNAATIPLFFDEEWDYKKVNRDGIDEEENIDEDYYYGYDKSDAYDPEYATQYRWRFNLMSTGREVPQEDDAENESRTFQYLYSELDYYSESNGGSTVERFSDVCIFITSRQWEVIKNKKDEKNELSLLGKTMMIFTQDDVIDFEGTFAGLKDFDGENEAVTDAKYDLDSENSRGGDEFSNFHHIMNGRILDDDNPTPEKIFNFINEYSLDKESFIKPYEGSQPIDLGKVVDDEYYPEKLYVGDDTDYVPEEHNYEDYKDSSNYALIRYHPDSLDDWPNGKDPAKQTKIENDDYKNGVSSDSGRGDQIWNLRHSRTIGNNSERTIAHYYVYSNRVIILEILREVEG